ncbi:phage major capsid protein [Ligilactobacillus murinus]|uniref:Phage major capsid protein n=1 Tax=Ligilactobacillus murinus TaxID=1622 RepID=A0A4V1PTN6_9LACO|nr:phage major capsid protein [Ligilactobacillus murinus]MCR1889623.1 phage major capsid protein [Ligilactobacillus murinus]NBH84900.1 phage major capsid protein [Lachnospiraceae bacterium]RXV75224.1 phage major capsid protein [Ligilactobacillus murinus]
MSIDLNKFPQFQAKKEAFATLVKNSAGQEEQAQAYSSMMNALTEDLSEYINQQVTSRVGELSAEKQPTMSKEEAKFFNDLATGDLSHSESHEVTFPETVVDKIFEDMVQNHPFLQLIKLNNTGLRLKFLKSDAKGAAVWGKITDEIKGQLTGTFSDESAEQSKLTAFVAVPNDVLEYGANWIKTFVMTQIQEAFAVALESAFLTGDGKDKPIGLNRQVQKDVAVAGGVYPEKASSGTLTFKDAKTGVKELKNIVKALSVKENGKSYVARGKVVLAVQPGASLDIEAAATMQNVNGQWVYALPFGVKTVESEYVPDGKVIAFVPDRYDAFVAGGVVIKEFDQTLALEDGHLYTAKRFAYGKASDDNVAKVYDLAIDDSTNETTGKADK